MLIEKVYFWFQAAKIRFALAAALAAVFRVFKTGLKFGLKPVGHKIGKIGVNDKS
jgi:hypothetical protein